MREAVYLHYEAATSRPWWDQGRVIGGSLSVTAADETTPTGVSGISRVVTKSFMLRTQFVHNPAIIACSHLEWQAIHPGYTGICFPASLPRHDSRLFLRTAQIYRSTLSSSLRPRLPIYDSFAPVSCCVVADREKKRPSHCATPGPARNS
jgi:hypothetical protein